MYTAVLMTALAATTAAPNWGHGYGCSCYNGYPSSFNPGCYGCYGCSCYGGYGFAGGGYGYHGGCYGAYGGAYDPGYGGCTGCYGCYGGHACYGMPLPTASVPQRSIVAPPVRDSYPPINPAPRTEVLPEKDDAEQVTAPKEKKKDVENKKMPEQEKKGSLNYSTPLRAKVRIEVPEGGKLFVDDHAINVPAGMRVFHTPPLTPGERYFYDIRIEWAGEIRSRRVIIEPGQDVAVSFPRLTPATRVQR